MQVGSYTVNAYQKIFRVHKKNGVNLWFWIVIGVFLIFMFLPWTQNIRSKGLITTRAQQDRTQAVQSPIAGKIEQWFVKEGDFVKKGDTILKISEIKEAYLDPNLIQRTQEQINAKRTSIDLYNEKAGIVTQQLSTIQRTRDLKVRELQAKNAQLQAKLKGEQAELVAATNETRLLADQLERQQKMLDEGLVSQTELQRRNIAYQNALGKKNSLINKVASTQQEILNNDISQNTAVQEALEKLQKAQGDRITSINEAATTIGDVAKLENQKNSYIIRNNMYIILAPQDGQIVQAKKSGIGELLKDGEIVTVIVPDEQNMAVELMVRPVDFPLVSVGQKVRLVFDGFPAIVFSGWPKGSYGTFGGEIVAYENTVNENGYFRVLVSPQKGEKWPSQLKMGSGAQSIVLLKNVSIWYELWRNMNGFPPDYYKQTKNNEGKKSAY
jgi:multidrug resistance efflux pump